MHRDGFGFVKPEVPLRGIEGDIFIPPENAQKAMHGDTVQVRVKRSGNRAEGDIVQILKHGTETIVGEFIVRKRGFFVKPHDQRFRDWIEIPSGLELPKHPISVDRVGIKTPEIKTALDLDGQIVNVKILEYSEHGDNAIGQVIEVLGRPDDFGVDVEITIRKHHLPDQFPEEVLKEARSFTEPSSDDLKGRMDFRDYDTVTIDGETARDFDDAVWLGRTPKGNWELHVHIADVSHYIQPGSAIDREAQLRGTSVYFPDRAIPMLPIELSTDICSLRPNVDRLVVSAVLEIDHSGRTVDARFTTGVIRSSARMTYTRVFEILENETSGAEFEKYSRMRDLALILNKKRVKRGSLDFDLPEAVIQFDEEGEMSSVIRGPRNIAHRIIEEFMLAANEAVAAYLEAKEVPSIYRIHETPEAKKILEFEEISNRFGVSLNVGAIPVKKHYLVQRTRDGKKIRRDVIIPDDSKPLVTSHNYQKLIAKIAGRPEERILSYMMLRSLKQARYSSQNEGHFALAAEAYTHFTSPIRRYPDLLVHRILTDRDHPSEGELHQLADDCSLTERRAAEAERELLEWKKAKFMMDRIGDEFPAIIISTVKAGFYVELDDLFIEGLVSLDAIPGDRYIFNDNIRRVVGVRTGRQYSIGDKLQVQLLSVDAVERRLFFAPVGEFTGTLGKPGGGPGPKAGKSKSSQGFRSKGKKRKRRY